MKDKQDAAVRIATATIETPGEVQRILQNIDQVVFSFDTVANKYIYISPLCEKLYGYRIDEFESRLMLWKEVIHADDAVLLDDYNVRIMAGRPLFYEYRIITKSGAIRWVEAKVVPTFDNAKNLLRVDIIVTNTTEKKEVQQKLELAHSDMHKLVNSISEVLFSVDMQQYKLTQMSAACFSVYGYTPEEFFTIPTLWKDVVHSEDIAIAEAHQDALYRGEQIENQYRINHKDGGLRWIENKITPTLDAKGTLIRIDGVTSDITKRKLAETELVKREKDARLAQANLSAIMNNTDAIIYSIDREFRYITFNKALADSLKLHAQTTIQEGDKIFGFLEESSPDEVHFWINVYTKAFAGEVVTFVKDFSTAEYQNHASFSIHPIWEDEVVIGLSCFCRDITQQRLAEQEIHKLNESLERKVAERTRELELSNAELESFSYSVSHDLRAPLRIINGFAKMLVTGCGKELNPEGKENLQVIMDTAGKMGELIDDLLAFSRLGRSTLEKKEVDMEELVRVVIVEAHNTYDTKRVEIIRHPLPTVNADVNLIKQVWCNLISNALKYSAKKEKPVITIGATVQDGLITYYVKDNGAGFDMEHSEKLFAVFQRLHKVSEYDGTGVGLALAQRIIIKHGGTIRGEGKVNEGATFYFTLPNTN